MCLTSVSLARHFAVGLHCPLTATPLKLTGDVEFVTMADFKD